MRLFEKMHNGIYVIAEMSAKSMWQARESRLSSRAEWEAQRR